jgi:hypothetical protein
MFEEESNNRKVQDLAVYQKAKSITDLVTKISEVIEDELAKHPKGIEKEMAERTLQDMIGNSYLLPAKIAGAEAVELYDLKMENAAIIRKAAREIPVACSGLELLGVENSLDYLQVLRDEIELFRIEFAEWVKTFDQWDYIIDRWGLFNPPGVNYDDHDPDDDIPFNPNDIDF